MRFKLLAAVFMLYTPHLFAGGDSSFEARPVAIDCTPLDPRRPVTEEIKLRAQANADLLLKKAASGNVTIEGSQSKTDPLKDLPNADQVAVKQFTAYLVCLSMQQNPGKSAYLATTLLKQAIPEAGKTGIAKQVLP